MKVPELQEIARAARALPEDARVPYAFEKRVMAAIRGTRPVDVLAFWNQTLWRAALACVAISLLTGVLAQYSSEPGGSGELFAAELEQAVLEPFTPEETW
jgi:hypothetical protein